MRKMKCFLVIILVFAAVTALPEESLTYEDYFDVEPVERTKRQTTTWNIKSPGIGTLAHSGTILDNDKHRLDGNVYAAKDFRSGGLKPDAFGGNLDYNHKPSGLDLGVSADHLRGLGTNVKASTSWNFINEKDAKVGISGYYGRQFGGPGGTGRPDYGVFVGGRINF